MKITFDVDIITTLRLTAQNSLSKVAFILGVVCPILLTAIFLTLFFALLTALLTRTCSGVTRLNMLYNTP